MYLEKCSDLARDVSGANEPHVSRGAFARDVSGANKPHVSQGVGHDAVALNERRLQ